MNSLADTQPIHSQAIRPVIWFSKQQVISYGLSAVSIILSILIWQLASHYHVNLGFINFANVPSPIDVIHSFVAFVELDTAIAHVKASIVRVLIGFLLAGLVGIVLGLLIGYSKAVAA
ncbi:MAG: ABC transporter permease, partial [Acinetobacter sp.]